MLPSYWKNPIVFYVLFYLLGNPAIIDNIWVVTNTFQHRIGYFLLLHPFHNMFVLCFTFDSKKLKLILIFCLLKVIIQPDHTNLYRTTTISTQPSRAQDHPQMAPTTRTTTLLRRTTTIIIITTITVQ